MSQLKSRESRAWVPMWRCVSGLIIVAVLIFSVHARANSFDQGGTQTMYYKGRPLLVEIPVNGERLLEFGRAIQVALPKDLVGKMQVESIAGTVYLTANTAFENKRFRFRDIDTGEILVLDLTATQGGASTPVRIRVHRPQVGGDAPTDAPAKNTEPEPISTVALVRFAFQQVYAPDRLIKPVAGIHEAKLKDARVIHHLFPGRGVLAKPLAQWRTQDGRYVTALYVRNTEQRVIEIDPRQIRAGRGWSTASFLTGVLAPASNVGDATTMVVVSDGAWEESTAWLR